MNDLRLTFRRLSKSPSFTAVAILTLALGLSRALSGLLYGVSPLDPVVFVGVMLLVSAITLLACWCPPAGPPASTQRRR